MKSQEATNWKEGRRIRAFELSQAGWQQKDIAAALGVTKGAVSKWLKHGREGGAEALRHQPPPGAVSKLTVEQLAQLPRLLAKGAEAYGYRGAVWTRKRVRQLIEDEFGVSYHVDHMSYLLDKIGWSRQKPHRRASQQKQEAVEAWQAEWPTVEKKPTPRGKP